MEHALRRVNPFRGVMQVVEGVDGRAASSDGVHWEIQLRVQLPMRWGYLNRNRVETAFCRYGGWSAEQGLTRHATPPQLDRCVAETLGRQLVAAVEEALPRLPFPLADRVECWQLDAARGTPLALLATQRPGLELPRQTGRKWQAVAAAATPEDHRMAGAVEASVSRLRRPGLAWIERGAQGDGRLLDADGRPGATFFGPEDFPELLLAVEQLAGPEREAYLDGLAPRLLMLPLALATRAGLEQRASRQPPLVERFYRLYPAIADNALLTSIRVQARLMAAA